MTATRTHWELRDLLYVLIGPGIWAAHFFALYGLEAIACTLPATPPDGSLYVRIIGGVLTGIAAAALLWLTAWSWLTGQPAEEAGVGATFLRHITPLLAALALLAVLWAALALVLLPVCTSGLS